MEKSIEKFIFAGRWAQAPLYVGLILASLLYAYKFMIELVHLVMTVQEISEEHLMLGILTLIDVTMVMNLIIMVVLGGYSTFVSHIEFNGHADRPDWLEKMDTGLLKIKLATALVSISGIHLLKSFVNIENKNPDHVMWQVVIHLTFLVSAVLLAWTEKIQKKN